MNSVVTQISSAYINVYIYSPNRSNVEKQKYNSIQRQEQQ